MSVTQVALVTGAGKGMSAACACELAARGWKLGLLSPSGGAARSFPAVATFRSSAESSLA